MSWLRCSSKSLEWSNWFWTSVCPMPPELPTPSRLDFQPVYNEGSDYEQKRSHGQKGGHMPCSSEKVCFRSCITHHCKRLGWKMTGCLTSIWHYTGKNCQSTGGQDYYWKSSWKNGEMGCRGVEIQLFRRVRHTTWAGVVNNAHTNGNHSPQFCRNRPYSALWSEKKPAMARARQTVAGDISRNILSENTSPWQIRLVCSPQVFMLHFRKGVEFWRKCRE